MQRLHVEVVVLVVCAACVGALTGCGPDDSGKSSENSVPVHDQSARKPEASAASTATETSRASASASSDVKVLTMAQFCQAAVELSEQHMASAPFSEKANLPSTGDVKPLSAVKTECAARAGSAKVEFHGGVASACIEGAKKRGGATTFFSFHLVPDCQGVVTGKATDGQPALYPEECAPGTAMVNSRCVKPVAKNGKCEDYPSGLLGKSVEHPRCEPGTECFLTRFSADGFPPEFTCLEPRPEGSPCKLDLNTCAQGTSCYQGKCRAFAASGGECMNDGHCQPGLRCEIKGGAFGTCKASTP